MTKTAFTSPETIAELQNKMADLAFEAADESAKRFELAMRETATTFASAMHANAERWIEAMKMASTLRAKSMGIAREAAGVCSAPAAK